MAAIRSVAHSQFLRGLFSNGSFYRAGVAVDADRSTLFGSVFNNRRLHSESQAAADNEETHEYEKAKMNAEGGGPSVGSFKEKAEEVKEKTGEKAEEVKEKTGEVKEHVQDKAEAVKDEAKGQASESADTAKGKISEISQEVSETATGLKEVGVEAGKAIKRDAAKVAEKVGLKSE